MHESMSLIMITHSCIHMNALHDMHACVATMRANLCGGGNHPYMALSRVTCKCAMSQQCRKAMKELATAIFLEKKKKKKKKTH